MKTKEELKQLKTLVKVYNMLINDENICDMKDERVRMIIKNLDEIIDDCSYIKNNNNIK